MFPFNLDFRVGQSCYTAVRFYDNHTLMTSTSLILNFFWVAYRPNSFNPKSVNQQIKTPGLMCVTPRRKINHVNNHDIQANLLDIFIVVKV